MPSVPPNSLPAWRRFWLRLGSAPVWLVVLARCLVGGVFVAAGFSKLILPQAEVEVLMQQYTVLPEAFIPLIAAGLPWLEIVSGAALASGFFTTVAALVVGMQLLAFCLLMSVILLLGIALEDCGCFGNLGIHETPLQVLLRDLVMLGLVLPVLARQRDVLSVDALNQSGAES